MMNMIGAGANGENAGDVGWATSLRKAAARDGGASREEESVPRRDVDNMSDSLRNMVAKLQL
jgi:hypothetical protein